jgi:hypothetical protein
MYLRRKTFLLDKRKLKKITSSSRALLVSRLLEQIADADTASIGAVKRGAAVATGIRRTGAPSRTAPRKLTAGRREKRYITEDDCINLRIELALCADSKEFISGL